MPLANLGVCGVKSPYEWFKTAGVEFSQTMKRRPWNAHDFFVRNLDGNLFCFAKSVD